MTTHLQVPYTSIPDMFLQRVADTPSANAFASPGPNGPVWLTWKTVGDRASAIAAGLHALGVAPEDRVAIACNTRVEWVLADLGIMCAGAATTTVYPTTEARDAAFILGDSGSKVLIAEDASQVAKIADANLPGLTHIVVISGTAEASVPVLTLAELEEKGRALLADRPRPGQPDLRRRAPGPPGHDHVHLRHDRHPQGGRAAARRLGLAGRGPGRPRHPHPARPRVPVAAAVALVRQDHPQWRDRHRAADLCRRSHRQDRREPRDHQADHHVWRAPDLREALQRDQRHREGHRRQQVQDLPVGVPGSAARCTSWSCAGRSRAACSRCATAWPTGWCSASSGPASAAGSGSSSPARPR